jgi:xylan 1,4-beta-xylosidase
MKASPPAVRFVETCLEGSQMTRTLIACSIALLFAGAVATCTRLVPSADDGIADSRVQFKSFSYTGSDAHAANVKAGEFLNPILGGFYPDPSICRVNDDYYLVNSTFWYFPGVPIFHSKDLVNWTQIGHVMDRPEMFSTMKGGDVSRGIYAPTIRHHEGTFYMICTLVAGGGNFYVTAKDPAGPWSDPVFLPEVEGMDPSLFFDDDSRAYVTVCASPPNNQALYNGHRTIRLRELDLKAGKMVGEEKIIVNGGTDLARRPSWCEGPHLYKRNGKYILLCAEGGTGTGHSEVVFMADTLWGPYTPSKENPILTQRNLPANRPDPVTCAGHADIVQTQNGDWWAVFLACQPYAQGFFNTGRQTFLLPLTWEGDQPRILNAGEVVPLAVKRPNLPAQPAPATALSGQVSWTDDFAGRQLAFRWEQLRAPATQWYAVKDRSLWIEPRNVALTGFENPSLIACRQAHTDCTASTILSVHANTADCEAGIVAFQNETHYYFMGVRVGGGKAREVFFEQPRGGAQSAPITATAPVSLPNGTQCVELKIECQGRTYAFLYRTDQGAFKVLKDQVDASLLSSITAGGFQGVMLGMYARRTPAQ